MSDLAKCVLCSGKDLELITIKPFRIVQCKRCSFTFRKPLPSKEELSVFYACAESSTHFTDQRLRALQAKERFRYVHRDIDMTIVSSLLEVGCDDGLFLHTVLQKYPQLKVAGIEPSKERAEFTRSAYGIKCIITAEMEEVAPWETFDLIACFHVLEHVADLHDFLSRIKAFMRPDSVLFLEIPDYSLTKFNLPFGKKILTPGYKFGEHLWFFTTPTLRLLLEKEGFKVESIKFVNFGIHPAINAFLMKRTPYLIPIYLWFSNAVLLPLNALGRGLQIRAVVKLAFKR